MRLLRVSFVVGAVVWFVACSSGKHDESKRSASPGATKHQPPTTKPVAHVATPDAAVPRPVATTCAQKIARLKQFEKGPADGGYGEDMSWLYYRSGWQRLQIPRSHRAWRKLRRPGALVMLDANGQVETGNPRRSLKLRMAEVLDVAKYRNHLKSKAGLIYLIAAHKDASVGALRKLYSAMAPGHAVELASPKPVSEIVKQVEMEAGVPLSARLRQLLHNQALDLSLGNTAISTALSEHLRGCPQARRAMSVLKKGGGIAELGPAMAKAYQACQCKGFDADAVMALMVAVTFPMANLGGIPLDMNGPRVAAMKDNDTVGALVAALDK